MTVLKYDEVIKNDGGNEFETNLIRTYQFMMYSYYFTN